MEACQKPLIKDVHRYSLKNTDLFGEFSSNMLDQVLDHASVKDFDKDALLCVTGDQSKYFYVILHGLVKLFRQTHDGHEAVTAVLTTGDVFGRNAVLDNTTLPYCAQTVTDATIIMISASFMRHMTQHHAKYDHFLQKFLKSGLDESARQNADLEHLALMTSVERVGCFLLKLCGATRSGSIAVTLPYEKSLVAAKLGMTPETFSRSLNQLSSIGVSTSHAKITINNIAQLQARICNHCSALRSECNLSDEPE